jgi:hypothetical protein
MAGSKTDIANMAISHLGVGKEIGNLDTENSQEANSCRRFYDTAREAVLRDAPWPFATTRRALALIATDPNDEWNYSYRYPSDCLFLRRILSGVRNDSRQSRAPYKLERDAAGQILFTDVQDAVAEYTIREEDVVRFPPDFSIALSYRLAVYVAPRLTAGDPFKLGVNAMNMYRIEIAQVRASAFDEEQPEEPPESEFIRARE